HPGFRAAAASGAVLRDLPLGRVASVLKQARVYVGNDSGISHMAAVLGVPSVVLFLATNPGIWRPPGDHVRILHRPSEGIAVDDVVPAIMKILS
ncbi:MAG TPA: glycosyltransferase family 9 protein, partial [Syntrophales bacterium]|nr:glycosyltransferase family 9 protein [Syntrophales bacterium]